MKIGDACPDFTLPSTDGIFRLSEKLGKNRYIVLYFYPKDNTPGCTTEACSFRDNMEDVTKYGADVYGISTDSIESHRKFASKHGLSFPLLSDEKGEVAKLFNAYNSLFRAASRKTFVISPEGKVVHIVEGVQPREHVRRVIEYLKNQTSK
ncbi:MAG: peroxiredoxin [Nitrososphaerota archaeon]